MIIVSSLESISIVLPISNPNIVFASLFYLCFESVICSSFLNNLYALPWLGLSFTSVRVTSYAD